MDCRVKPGNDRYLQPRSKLRSFPRKRESRGAGSPLSRGRADRESLEAPSDGSARRERPHVVSAPDEAAAEPAADPEQRQEHVPQQDRKSTRLNFSHLGISYAVFCLKTKR